jgi:hypothetical protein
LIPVVFEHTWIGSGGDVGVESTAIQDARIDGLEVTRERDEVSSSIAMYGGIKLVCGIVLVDWWHEAFVLRF